MIGTEHAVSAAFIATLITLSLTMAQPVSKVSKEPSKMRNYVLYDERTKNRREAYEICQSYGGHLLNLDSPQTEVFLQRFSESHDVSVREGMRYYTSLRQVRGVLTRDDCKAVSEKTREFATNSNTDYGQDMSEECFQVVFRPDWIDDPSVAISGRWCNCTRNRKFICEIQTTDLCTTEEHHNVAIVDLEQMPGEGQGDCGEQCFSFVHDDKECWYFGSVSGACNLWLGYNQPVQHPFKDDRQDNSRIYSKNCIRWMIKTSVQLGPQPITDEYETCVTEAETVPRTEPGDISESSLGSVRSDDTVDLPSEQSDPGDDPLIHADRPEPVISDDTHGISPSPGSLALHSSMWTSTETPLLPTSSVNLVPTAATIGGNIALQVTPEMTAISLPSDPAHAVNAQSPSLCDCPCPVGGNDTEDEKAQFTEGLVANLTIDTKNTSANIRKYVSAEDPRPSARNIGGVGAVLLGVVFGGLIIPDFVAFVNFVYKLVQKGTSRDKVKNIHIPSNS